MITPGLAEFRKLARPGRRVPVVREILADTETPVSTFLKVATGPYAFLLESVESGEKWSRYSLLGTDPSSILTIRGSTVEIRTGNRVRRIRSDDPLAELGRWQRRQRPVELEGLPPFWGGAVGFVSYDAVRSLEKLPRQADDDLGIPDAVFMLADTVVVFDNLTLTMKIISSMPAGKDAERTYRKTLERIDEVVARLKTALPERETRPPSRGTARRFRSSIRPAAFRSAVRKAKKHILAGDVVQVVLSQRFEKSLKCDPFEVYRSLRVINPSSYMYYLRMDDRHIVGSSPEVLVRHQHGEVEVRPIAGTRPRGADSLDDRRLEEELISDPKECAEHVMLVDLGRNDVGRVAEFGSVNVTEFMNVERYSHVMHIVSNVVGKVRRGVGPLDSLKACFPAGTVSGAPKVRAMEIIEDLEPIRRGVYAGAVGYLSFGGSLDTCIAIRTALVERGRIYVGCGAGIVADSDPEREYRETVNKARALFAAVEAAESGTSRRRRSG